MDLAELKNIDAKELIQKLKNSDLLKDKKTLATFGIGFFAIILSLIIYHSFISPIIQKQENDITLMQQNQMQMDDLNMQITNLKEEIKIVEPEYKKNSALFHSKKEVEDLYQSISNFALANGLSIVNISKEEPKPVKGDLPNSGMMDPNMDPSMMDPNMDPNMDPSMMDPNMDPNMMDPNMDPNMMDPMAMDGEGGSVLYYKIPVKYEIRGTFLGYLKFRRALSKSNKVVNFDNEEILLLKEPQGQVLSKGTISIVGLPDEYK